MTDFRIILPLAKNIKDGKNYAKLDADGNPTELPEDAKASIFKSETYTGNIYKPDIKVRHHKTGEMVPAFSDIYIKGIASGTALDLDQEKMTKSALLSMIKSIKNGVEMRESHNYEYHGLNGQITELFLTKDSDGYDAIGYVGVLNNLDLDPQAAKLYYSLQRGAMLGVSVGGKIGKHHYAFDNDAGRNVLNIDEVSLTEISTTSFPAYSAATAEFVKNLTKFSMKKSNKDLQKTEEIVAPDLPEVGDTQENADIVDAVVSTDTEAVETPVVQKTLEDFGTEEYKIKNTLATPIVDLAYYAFDDFVYSDEYKPEDFSVFLDKLIEMFGKLPKTPDETWVVQVTKTKEGAERFLENVKKTLSDVLDTPVADAPVADAPVVDAPVVDTPVADAPAVDAPVADAPVAEDPVADAPVADAPVAEDPVVDAPVADDISDKVETIAKSLIEKAVSSLKSEIDSMKKDIESKDKVIKDLSSQPVSALKSMNQGIDSIDEDSVFDGKTKDEWKSFFKSLEDSKQAWTNNQILSYDKVKKHFNF